MLSPESSNAQVSAIPEAVELHFFPKKDIESGRFTVALCGDAGVPVKNSQTSAGGTSYTCPDCMLRYSLLTGGANNA
mgnify:CR=1 FL=1